ncbi:hypothetical protein [Pseudanabaena sp. PCC 6802]|uniref:hypothetical protein n=1 Tax=Pseudanabaena sp. PCC 6802 TaxID=118173 RepID=UPI00034916EA|nr:hypothetical protein [Pseudanabaena sp. PCC 6802]
MTKSLIDPVQETPDEMAEITTTVYLKDGKTEQVKLAELDNYLKANQEKIEPRKVNPRRSQIKHKNA